MSRAPQSAWGIADQAVSSGGNFALWILVARSSTARQVGYFSLSLTIYAVAIGLARAYACEPLLSLPRESRKAGSLVASGALGAVSLMILPPVALLLGISLGGRQFVVPMLIAILPLLLLDMRRYEYFAAGRAEGAVLLDSFWTVSFGLITGAIALVSRVTPEAAFASWLGSGVVVGLLAGLSHGLQPSLHRIRNWHGLAGSMSTALLAEAMLFLLAMVVATAVIGGLTGVESLGAYRAASLLVSPAALLLPALLPVLVASDRHLGRQRTDRLYALGLSLASSCWLAALLLVPTFIGRAVLGDTWRGARDLLVPVGAALVLGASVVVPQAGMRRARRGATIARLRLALTPISVVIPAAACWAWHIRGYAWGYATYMGVQTVVTWWLYLAGGKSVK